MWNPFSKESVLRDLRTELKKIEQIDQEHIPTLETMAKATPVALPGADIEPVWLAQKLMNADNLVRQCICSLEEGFATTGQIRARTAFLAGNVRGYRRQLTQLKRKDYWVEPGDAKVVE